MSENNSIAIIDKQTVTNAQEILKDVTKHQRHMSIKNKDSTMLNLNI